MSTAAVNSFPVATAATARALPDLHPAAPVNPPHLHSAFPLLNISPELRR